MSQGKVVVIGGDAAGMSAASKVRRTHPDRKIVVFERGPHTSYSACGMPYYISGEIESPDHLIARTPDEFREKYQIDVKTGHEAVSIDPKQKTVTVRILETGAEFEEKYDQLLIATGASPIRPPIEGMDAAGIFSLSILQSGIEVFDYVERESPQKAVIVGGGYIGIEMAEALSEKGMDVTMIDMAAQVMPTLDPDMAERVFEYMSGQGINLRLNEKLTRFEAYEGKVTAVTTEQKSYDADIVVLGMGVKPNSKLAEEAGLKTGVKGAIHVDKHLRTSEPDIWAAGDCAESFHRITGKQTWIALGTVANKHGLVAGINLSGGDQPFPGVVGTAITKFKDLEISRTGLSEKELNDEGIKNITSVIESSTRAGYYPGGGSIHVKLLAEQGSGRLLGGQIVGFAGAAKRIDTLAAAITSGMTAEDLAYLDLSYAPPFSPVWDPVQTAARKLI
jgi:NADPH-dependent 2,4-dienoyl-CoA reductase/sulfur reductase-like enzyme